MERIKIVEKQIYLDSSKPKADILEYGISEIKLGSYAIFYARLVNSLTGIMFDNQMIKMEGEDYQGWNDDIPYVENFILQKLGLEKQVTE